MSRFYEIEGKQLPSVTTILGKMLAKEALVPWAAKCTAAAFKELVSEQIKEFIGTDIAYIDANLEQIEAQAKKAYRTKSTEAMSKGTLVHEAIEQWIGSGGKMTPDELTDPVARQGLEQFLTWGEQHDIDIISYEEPVSDGESFAGRYDLFAVIDGKRTLLDFKTSNGIYDEYKIQVNAYASCLDNVEQVAVLRLDKETGEIEYASWEYDTEYVKAFKCMATAYNILFPYKAPKRGKKEVSTDGN